MKSWMEKSQTAIIIIGLTIGVLVLAAFMSLRKAAVPVRAEKAVRETIVNVISTNGKIEGVENFEAHAAAAATVKRLLVREGDHVKAGQLLVQLDDADARAQAAHSLAQLRSAEADMAAIKTGGTREEVLINESQLTKARTERDAAMRNLNGFRHLKENGAASPAEVEDADNRYKRAEAEVQLLEQKRTKRYSPPEVNRVQARAGEARAAYDAAQQSLASSNVTSPRAGMVYSLPVRQGAYVNPGDLLVQVADITNVQVRAFVDEPEIGRLARGQKVTITWDAMPGRQWEGIVSRVPTTVIQRGTRNVGEITCVVPNPDLKLLPNINVTVTVTTAHHENAITLPREAVRQDPNGKRFVYEIVNGKLKRRDVEIATSNLTKVEIAKGLAENAEVAVSAASSQPLQDGLAVRIAER